MTSSPSSYMLRITGGRVYDPKNGEVREVTRPVR
jgi:hypothetical protein